MPLITVCALFVLLLRVIANSSLGLIYELHFPAGVYVESSPCRVWDCPWSQASAGGLEAAPADHGVSVLSRLRISCPWSHAVRAPLFSVLLPTLCASSRAGPHAAV